MAHNTEQGAGGLTFVEFKGFFHKTYAEKATYFCFKCSCNRPLKSEKIAV